MLRNAQTILRTALAISAVVLPWMELLSKDFQWNSISNTTWENSSNWLPSTGYPRTNSDTANFLNGTFANPTLSSSIFLNTINFSGGAYTFSLAPSAVLQMQGNINGNTSTLQNVALTAAGIGFNGSTSSASGGVGTGGVAYTVNGSIIEFNSSSTAANASMHFTNVLPNFQSYLLFANSSSAGSATISIDPVPALNTTVEFSGSSSAASSTISGSAVVLDFINTASAGSCTINLNDGSTINFASASNQSKALVQGAGTDVSISGVDTSIAAMQLSFDVLNSLPSSLNVSADSSIGYLATDALTPIDLISGTLTVGDISSTTLAGPISGVGALYKQGAGTLTLAGQNSYTGGTEVDAGTLAGTTESLVGNIQDNATVTFNQALNGTYNGRLSGTGVVNIGGGGTIIFSNNSSGFSGTVVVNDSELKMNIVGQIGGNIVLQDDALFTLNRSQVVDTLNSDALSMVNLNNLALTVAPTGTSEIDGPVIGSTGGALIMNGPGTLFLNGNNSPEITLKIYQGEVVGNTNSISGYVIDNSVLTFDQASNGNYAGLLSGGGIVNIEGGGTIEFDGDSSGFTGTLNVISSGLSSGPTGFIGGNLNLQDNAEATLNNDQELLSLNTDATSTVDLNLYTLILDTTGSDLIAGAISGTGGTLVMAGPGEVTLAGNNSFSNLVVENGIVNGTTTSLPQNIEDDSILDINQNTAGTYSGTITGSGTLVINGLGGTGTVTITGENSYEGGTEIAGGALAISSDQNLGATGGAVTFLNESELIVQSDLISDRPIFLGFADISAQATINTSGNTVELDGEITDYSQQGSVGQLVVEGNGTLILGGVNSYSGGTDLVNGTLIGDTNSLQGDIFDDGTLEFDQDFDGTYAGNISGTGQVIFDGTGDVTLTGLNTYTGGTFILSGAVQGDTDSLHGDIFDNGTLIFNQASEGTFRGQLVGTGNVIVNGSGIVRFLTESRLFRGETIIDGGYLALDNYLGGDLAIRANGVLSGRGSVGGNLIVGEKGTVSPGVETLRVDGNFVQKSGSLYVAEIERNNRSSVLSINGTALLEPGAALDIVSTDGSFNPHITYQLLFANAGLEGTYSDVVLDHAMITPEVIYTNNNVYLRLVPAFSNVVTTVNQGQVASQIENIVDPNASERALQAELLQLSPSLATSAFDHMTAAQYSMLILSAESSTHQFIRRLYDPLRFILATRPPIAVDDCGGDGGCSLFNDLNIEYWGEVSYNRGRINGNCNSRGCSLNDFETSIGVHKRFNSRWTAGLAISYDINYLNFSLSGKGNQHSLLGGIYALYRPYAYYFLGDFVFGTTKGHMRRSIRINPNVYTAKGHSHLFQGAFYGEFGKDWLLCSLLVQPFVGVELGYYKTRAISESGAGLLDMAVKGNLFYNALSSLGVHISTLEEEMDMLLALDLAWVYRMTSTETVMRQSFQNFGSTFTVNGPSFRRNSFEITAYASKPLDEYWEIYGELTSRIWAKSHSYSLIAGARAQW
jgi:fibronectin-binding autotransporter adhesin